MVPRTPRASLNFFGREEIERETERKALSREKNHHHLSPAALGEVLGQKIKQVLRLGTAQIDNTASQLILGFSRLLYCCWLAC